MKSNFQSDDTRGIPATRSLVDPEAYDASEQQFAASLEEQTLESGQGEEAFVQRETAAVTPEHPRNAPPPDSAPTKPLHGSENDFSRDPDPDAWREEVAARLDSYRARRRPRGPRYPSLQLKFEPAEPAWNPHPHPAKKGSPLIHERPVAGETTPIFDESPATSPRTSPAAVATESTARVLPFRRATPAPPKPLEELAEPMRLFPRILEVPEVAPPAPALGGILIEPQVPESCPKRPGIEIPLQTASLSRRGLAAVCDAAIVVAAFSLFAFIFFEITATTPALKPSVAMGAIILGIVWSGYEYLLLTYAGITPGLMLTRLRLSQFDGAAVSRRARRWRAFASVLSALSLGLGYAWCMLDEDQLCWHDRITRTHLAPR